MVGTKVLRAQAAILAALLAMVGMAQASETLSFQQLNWYGLNNTTSTPDIPYSDWGQLTLDYVDSGTSQYFNLNVDGNWVIENRCITPLAATAGSPQTVNMKFDLHVSDGTPVSSVNYGYSLTPDPVANIPSLGGSANVTPLDYQIGGDDAIDLAATKPIHASQKIKLPEPPLAIGVLKDFHHFVNQPQGANECAPGAISNSLKYLAASGRIRDEIPDDISDVKPWIGWDSDGAPADWPDRKKTELEGRIGQRVTVRKIEAPLTLAKVIDLISELEDGQDIEMDLKGHVEVLVGLRLNADGTVDLALADDNQKDQKSDPIHVSRLKTDGNADFVDGMELERFVVECPGEIVDVFDAFLSDGLLTGWGSGYGDGTWYYYTTEGCYTQWFYDHPVNMDRHKTIDLHLEVTSTGQPETPGELEVTIDWATPLWPDDMMPPVPGEYPIEEEDLYIERETVYLNIDNTTEIVDIPFLIPEYNPEWVSVSISDVTGNGVYSIVGTIAHQCVPNPYTLTTNAGTGGGTYSPGTVVLVQADAPPPDSFFDVWVGDVAALGDLTASTTIAVMPNADAEVTATYQPGATLTVHSGSGGGLFEWGTIATIVADPVPPDSFFDVWVGDTFQLYCPGAPSTLVTLFGDVEVTATYTSDPVKTDDFWADLVNGQLNAGGGSGFDGGNWYYYELYGWYNQWWYDHPFDPDRMKMIDLVFNVTTTTPGVGNLEIVVNWATPDWPSGGLMPPLPGDFLPSEEDIYIGRQLVYSNPGQNDTNVAIHFEIPDYNPEWISLDIRDTSMEGSFALAGSIRHECAAKLYQLTVNNGSGDGPYPAGTPVVVTAGAPPAGWTFCCWTGDVAILDDSSSPNTTATMPAADAEITAVYCELLDGDLNGDGWVGQPDLDIVLDQWGRTGLEVTDPRADPDNSGWVGQPDLDIVLDDWGQSCP